MVGSGVGVYNVKTSNQVAIKPEMISHYLGEFSVTCKLVTTLGQPGIGATPLLLHPSLSGPCGQ
ncbi:unnamed protein product [Nyctereutes procyonoides]|uniref:40S ribosomal protein S15 n=1 Tax=Nyctereutes procyonoides TaxID=34880 RepID=A0A811ZQM8_NYCPR|nr:unnamed protein product [Nyctereutes procyonoides]